MTLSAPKRSSLIPPAVSSTREAENYRVKPVGTRLTEAEFTQIEATAAKEGKKVSEWLRDAILVHLSVAQDVKTDPVLLAELMAVRTLMLNLFATASKGPLSDEDLRKMSVYSESIKQQKAEEFLAKLRAKSGVKPPEETP